MDYFEIINKKNSPLYVIDIGCHKGHWYNKFLQSVENLTFSIGVDPCNYPKESPAYTHFLEYAIDAVESETVQDFYVYPKEPGCNSLLPMKREGITHDFSKRNESWFVGWDIESEEYKSPVRIIPAARIFDLIPSFGGRTIDFVKIDGQGKDVDIVKSFCENIVNIHFVQIESVSSHDESITLYKGQKTMEQDIEEMDKLGFDVFSITDYSGNASPEADIIFRNRLFV